jgi:6-phosphogluconolactonase
MADILLFNDQKAWLAALADQFRSATQDAITKRTKAHVALSGGSTPKPFYSYLNERGYMRKPICWWLGDERWVPATDALSNEKMIAETLGKDSPDFKRRFQSWHLDPDPKIAAEKFEEKLCEQLGVPPIFDVVLLGVGTDGHTASLFPGTKALEERNAFAVANHVPQMPESSTRLTLTYPTLNAARQIWFLVSGADKEPMVTRLQKGDATIPSANIQNSAQKIFWLT